MDIDFPTPQEEIDLNMLRSKVNRAYQQAFKQMKYAKDDRDIINIVHDTIRHVDQLVEAHEKKHSPSENKEPF